MVVSRMLWADRLRDRDVIHYVDNEGAKYGVIKGSSPSRESAWLIHAFWDREIKNRSRSWVSRVPTCCNIGDGPSRGAWEEVHRIWPECKECSWTNEQEIDFGGLGRKRELSHNGKTDGSERWEEAWRQVK